MVCVLKILMDAGEDPMLTGCSKAKISGADEMDARFRRRMGRNKVVRAICESPVNNLIG